MSPSVLSNQQLLDAIAAGDEVPVAGLHALFDRLDVVDDPAFLIGQWRGGVFTYDHPIGRYLQKVSWYGKRFESVDDVQPFLLDTEDGPQPFEKMGTARLREVAYDGRLAVAMIYDRRPVIDHFRRVSDDVLLAVGEEKGQPTDYFFHLTRERGAMHHPTPFLPPS